MWQKIGIALRGMAMGAADVIPGVSGGTMALILGIYEAFIEGIKSIHFRWIPLTLKWAASGFGKEAGRALWDSLLEIHWGFLVPLAVGIVFAFGAGSVLVPDLMDRFPVQMSAFFMGLILASIIVPWRQMTERGPKHFLIGLVFTGLTFVVVGTSTSPSVQWRTVSSEETVSFEDFMREHPATETPEELYCPRAAHDNLALREAVAAESPEAAVRLARICAELDATVEDLEARVALRERENLGRKDEANPFLTVEVPAGTEVTVPVPSLVYIFLCGLIAICAMVLPGISGSFFLLILGVYHFMLSSALKGFIYALIDGRIPQEQGAYVVVFCLGCGIGLLSFARVMSYLFKEHRSTTLVALIGLMLGSLRVLWPFKIGEPHTGVQNVMPPLDGTVVGPAIAFLAGFALVAVFTVVGERLGTVAPGGPRPEGPDEA